MRCGVLSLLLTLILPAGAAVTPVFQFAESWMEQVQAVREPCDEPPCPIFYDEVANNSASFKLIIPWTNFDPNALQWDTAFALRLGDWQFQRTLGEALNYMPGAASATFVETGEDAAGRAVTLSRVYLKWTSSSLVVTGYDRALIPSMAAANHLDEPASFREWVPGEVTLGGFAYARSLFTTGTTTVRNTTAGTGDARQEFFLSTVKLTGSADYTPPTVILSSPLAGTRWFADTIVVRGTARDNSSVTGVLMRVNDGKFQPTIGTNAWTNVVALVPGTNTIQVKAIDADANESTVVSTRVVFVVTNALTLVIHPPGAGKVTGLANGQSLEIGRAYRATATPLGTNLFAGWTGDWPGSNSVHSFYMLSNMSLTANFAPNPFIARQTTYRGLFSPQDGVENSTTNVGSISVTLGSKGVFSGSIFRANGTHAFTGTFDLSGAATVLAKRTGAAPLTVTLQLDVIGTNGITGVVGDGVWSSALSAEPIALAGTAAAIAGRYNFRLPGAADSGVAPTNDSTGSITLAANNTYSSVFNLADSTRVLLPGSTTSAAFLPRTRNNKWPVFTGLYSGRGFLAGWVQFDVDAQPTALIGSNMLWLRPSQSTSTIYPAGFLLRTWLEGARVVPVAATTTAVSSSGSSSMSLNSWNVAGSAALTQSSSGFAFSSTSPIGTGGSYVAISGSDPWAMQVSLNPGGSSTARIFVPAKSTEEIGW